MIVVVVITTEMIGLFYCQYTLTSSANSCSSLATDSFYRLLSLKFTSLAQILSLISRLALYIQQAMPLLHEVSYRVLTCSISKTGLMIFVLEPVPSLISPPSPSGKSIQRLHKPQNQLFFASSSQFSLITPPTTFHFPLPSQCKTASQLAYCCRRLLTLPPTCSLVISTLFLHTVSRIFLPR